MGAKIIQDGSKQAAHPDLMTWKAEGIFSSAFFLSLTLHASLCKYSFIPFQKNYDLRTETQDNKDYPAGEVLPAGCDPVSGRS